MNRIQWALVGVFGIGLAGMGLLKIMPELPVTGILMIITGMALHILADFHIFGEEPPNKDDRK